MRFQKFMWHNMKRSTKTLRVLILHYNIDRWMEKRIQESFSFPSIGPRDGNHRIVQEDISILIKLDVLELSIQSCTCVNFFREYKNLQSS